MSARLKPLSKYHGLQMLWDDGQELEIIPWSKLKSIRKNKSKISTTSIVSGVYAGKRIEERITYQANAYREGNTITIEYVKEPAIYKKYKKYGWNGIGITTIKFNGRALQKVVSINWLQNGKDSWVENFKHCAKAQDNGPRSKTTALFVEREQTLFKSEMLPFDRECVVTGTVLSCLLQAAHVIPVKDNGTDSIENGFLLRADLHILFDNGHFKIHPKTGRIIVCTNSGRKYLDGLKINTRIHEATRSRIEAALVWKWNNG